MGVLIISREKIFNVQEDERSKIAKEDRNYKFAVIDYISKEENKKSKPTFLEIKKEIPQEEQDIFIENENKEEDETKFAGEIKLDEEQTIEKTEDSINEQTVPTENPIEKAETITPRNLEQFQGKPLLAFTFDDGPNSETTNRLLDNLDKYNARVTFFVVGNRIHNNTDTLKRAYDMGNQIGSHSYSHRNFFKLDEAKILEEVQNTNNAIKEVIGVEPTLIRPPYGNKDADKIAEYIVNNVHDGAIILLHDIYDPSIDGTLKAMEILEQQGYGFVTIDEMAQLKNVELDKDISYHYFYNELPL